MVLLSSSYIRLTADDIKLDAYYDPRLLSDYGGPCFQHQKARLKQLDVCDVPGDLIPPWEHMMPSSPARSFSQT
jgi:hypothetical protein